LVGGGFGGGGGLRNLAIRSANYILAHNGRWPSGQHLRGLVE